MSSDSTSSPWTPSSASDVSTDDSKDDLIAIVGMACRLPGGVNDTTDFWNMLVEGRTGQCKVPSSRFNVDSFYQTNGSDAPGGVNHSGGYYINDDMRLFDHEFFGILKAEAAVMDPQQRKLLEVVFECLESAGIPLDAMSGSETGCFVGSFAYDFAVMQMKDPEYLTRHAATGMGSTLLSNRLSHVFNLKGPSLTIDTACSSSLYCLHSACVAIENGDCNSAIVAGANLVQSVEQSIGMMKAGVLSDTSACNTFTDNANGYARADGIGAIYLKRLSDAIRDGDPIRSVIRATAVGANGRTAGISAPSSTAQEQLIRKAYRRAGLGLDGTKYIECHGTGTKAGDSGEVKAISRVFARTPSNPLLMGSVKTNVGHSEAVSGLSGIIKTVLALEKAVIPPSVIQGKFTKSIQQLEPAFQVARESTEWPGSGPRRAGVNSFGYGGANGHVILESAPDSGETQVAADLPADEKTFLLPFSAASGPALDQRVSDVAAFALRDHHLGDLAHTLGCRRTHFPVRGFLLAKSKEAISLANLKMAPTGAFPKKICFVFTGQGAQWPRMGAEILQHSSIFRASFKHMDAILQALPDPPKWTLEASILDHPKQSRMHEAVIAQPAATALQVALVDLLASWNIFPNMVVGHSSGEIAAAYAAGRISTAEAIVSAYYRGLLNDQNKLAGAMMAVGLSQEDSAAELDAANANDRVKVACVNSSSSTTWSGDEDTIDELLQELNRKNIFARKLKTGGKAYHSHHMEPLGPQLETLIPLGLKEITKSRRSRTIDCRFISTVTGEYKETGFDSQYWRQNMESPVLFLQAIEELLKAEDFHYVEVGPHSALSLPIKQIRTGLEVSDERAPYSTVLTRGENSMDCALALAGRLFAHGLQPSFQSINGSTTSFNVLVDMPRYPWQYQEPLWLEPRISAEFRNRPYPYHELLGSWVPGGDGVTSSWRNRLQIKHVGWLSGHQLESSIIFPAAGYIAMAIEAAMQVGRKNRGDLPGLSLRRISINKALIVPLDQGQVEVFTTLHSNSTTGWSSFEIVSFSNGNSSIHASGEITLEAKASFVELKAPKAVCLTKSTAWYSRFAEVGMGFSRDFQSLNDITADSFSAQASTSMLTSLHNHPSYGSSYPIHPVTLDAMLQLGIIAKTHGIKSDLSGNVPVAIEEITIRPSHVPNAAKSCSVVATTVEDSVGGIEVTAELRDTNSTPFAQLKGVKMAPFAPSTLVLEGISRQPICNLVWEPDTSFRVNNNIMDNIEGCAASLLDLLVHKRPGLRVLEILDSSIGRVDEISHVLGRISDTGTLGLSSAGQEYEDAGEEKFDVVLIPKYRGCSFDILCDTIKKHLADGGHLIAMLPLSEIQQLHEFGFETRHRSLPKQGSHLTLATFTESGIDSSNAESPDTIIVMPSAASPGVEQLSARLAAKVGGKASMIPLTEISDSTIPHGALVISLIEAGETFFATASETDLVAIRPLIERASKIIWITQGGLIDGSVPEYALSSGIARSVRLEHPSLSFVTFDLEVGSIADPSTVSNIIGAIGTTETELCQKGDLVHICRFSVDEQLNKQFLQMEGTQLLDRRLADAGASTLRLGSNASFESAYFVADHEQRLRDGFLDIKVDSISLDAMTLQSLSNKTSTEARPLGFDSSGTVLTAGLENHGLTVGDRVIALAPGQLSNRKTAPLWACVKLKATDQISAISSFAIAFYGLRYQAKIDAGDRVLVTDGLSAIGQAAIQIGKLLKSEVFATVKSYSQARQLRKLYGLNAQNILVTHNAPLTRDARNSILAGLGANVLFLTSLEDLPGALSACADLGHVVVPAMDDSLMPEVTSAMTRHGISISAADLQRLYSHSTPANQGTYKDIMERVVSLLRSGSVTPIHGVRDFDVSQLTDAVSNCTSADGIGAVNVIFKDDESMVKWQMPNHIATFKSNKSYLLVGCLGGLGRTISSWMVSRGAQYFTFLSRSGDDKDAAKALVRDLTSLGAHVKVVRGDVSRLSDVESAVEASEMDVAGVVHAAMGLDESLFTRMSAEALHKSLRPKLLGARNLQKALAGTSLDFMLLTSSVSGSIGIAAQANYCAANAFLDAFALHLRTHMGVPAVAVGLSMVSDSGFLAENPQAASLMARTGIAPLDSDEVLRIIDIALRSGKHHILTGLDPGYFVQLCARQEGAVFPAADDPRTVHLLPAHAAEDEAGAMASGLPQDVTQAMTQGMSFEDAVRECVASQLAQLLQIRRENVDVQRPLSAYGLDSMLATELRGWLWTAFSANVTFLELLADTATAQGLATTVCTAIAGA